MIPTEPSTAARHGPLPADEPPTRPMSAREPASLVVLLRGLADDLTRLMSQQVALAKEEVLEAVAQTRTGLVSLGLGAAVLFAGLLVLLLAAVYGLRLVVTDWLAALIVGTATVLVGAVLLLVAKRRLSADGLKPDRTLRSLDEDRKLAKRIL